MATSIGKLESALRGSTVLAKPTVPAAIVNSLAPNARCESLQNWGAGWINAAEVGPHWPEDLA